MSEYHKTAWTDGEQAVFAALVDATAAIEGQTAFLGVLPPQLDCWALNVSGGAESGPFKDMPPPEIKFDGILQGQFSPDARHVAQETAMAWLAALPVKQTGVVYVARATRPPVIDYGFIPVFKNGKEVSRIGCWQVTLEIECIFRVRY
jgi:hypothetical protein